MDLGERFLEKPWKCGKHIPRGSNSRRLPFWHESKKLSKTLHSAKEVFEECRSALIDLSKSDQQLIESAEAAMSTEPVDDPTVAQLQQDLDLMHGHLTNLKSSAEAMAVDSNNSAKRPRLNEPTDLTGEAEDGAPSLPGPLEPFGTARK